MKIKSFEAKNFRNIKSCKIEFSDGINLLIGKNAQGKTSVAEGIYIFSRGKSFRGNKESELVSFGEDGFYTSVEYERKNGEEKLEYSFFGKERVRKKNGYKINKITEMIENFKCVLFVPDDLSLIKGGPEERRNFLNVAVSQVEGKYIDLYKSYKKALENRNCILKKAKDGFYYDKDELLAWNSSLAEYSSEITLIRKKYVKDIEKYAKKIMYDLSGESEEISISYKSEIKEELIYKKEIEEEYIKIYSSEIPREIAAGYTLFGPNRDDIEFKINQKEGRIFASQGQQRSMIISLKLAEGEVIREVFGEYPVFIFDDVMSELDEERKKYVLSGSFGKQIIITSCDIDNYKDIASNIINVNGGEYVSSYR